jgi:DDE family transposase
MEGITLHEHFATLEDPRVERTKYHQRLSIITIALCGVICGADTWVDIEEFGKAKRAWLETFLELPNGIPSHDTFGRVAGTPRPGAVSRVFSLVGAGDPDGFAGPADCHRWEDRPPLP